MQHAVRLAGTAQIREDIFWKLPASTLAPSHPQSRDKGHPMTKFGKAAIVLALSAAMMANVPMPAKAGNDTGAALVALFGAAVVGAAIAHAASAPPPAKRKVVVVTQKCHNEALPVLNSAGKQIAIQEKRVCE
jgi:hypothetical protein